MTNQHQLPIRVVGYGRDKKRMLTELEQPLLLWPAAWQPADSDSLFAFATAGAAATHLFYRLPGLDQLFASPILPTSAPLTPTDWQSLLSSLAPAKEGSYKISGTCISISDGAQLDWTGLRLEDCPTGFAAFQKKPEFGPAQITITGLEVDAVGQLQNASGFNRIIID